MLPVILPMIPVHEVYTEVFFGGGAVFWAKKPVKNETINDTLDIVVNFYRQVKMNFDALNREIQATCFSRTLHDKALLIVRNKELFSPVELAWAFWMLSNFSYGNKIGGGLKYSNEQSIMPQQVMQRYKENFTTKMVQRIESTVIESRDAVKVLESRNVAKSFHYIDPPYSNADNGHYGGYTIDHLETLLKWMETSNGKFLFSNYQSDMLQDFVKKNNWKTSMHTYNNKGMRKHDISKCEILVWNYDLPNKQLF